jgi:hypothetical protein
MTAELWLFKGEPPPPGDPPELEAPPLPVSPPEPEALTGSLLARIHEISATLPKATGSPFTQAKTITGKPLPPDPPEPEVFPDSLRDDIRVQRIAIAFVVVLMVLVIVLGAAIIFLLWPPSAPPPAASVAPPDVHIHSAPVTTPVNPLVVTETKSVPNITIPPAPAQPQAVANMARWWDARVIVPRKAVAPRRHRIRPANNREIADLPVLHDTTPCPLSICFVPLSQRN